MLRYKLRTLLLLLAALPPLLWLGWTRYEALREQERRRAFREAAEPADLTTIRVGVSFD